MAALRSHASGAAAGLALATIVAATSGAVAAQKGALALRRIDAARLCVTSGAVSASGSKLAIEAPSVRAVVRDSESAGDQIAEIRFQYLGPTQEVRRLASGTLRRQIGLKLRAESGCNLIYAMWRIEPEARVVVSVKRNPGQHAYKACGARGYVDFGSNGRSAEYPVRPGETHTLRAVLRGRQMTVMADGTVVWQGVLATPTPLPTGATGLRSDNGRFVLEYFAQVSAASRSTRRLAKEAGCGTASED